MVEWLAAIGMLIGAGFVFLAALGLVRFPDLYTRMHAGTKAGVLGVGFVVLSVALVTDGLAGRAVAAVVFVALTGPVAAHALGRARYRS